MISHTPQLFSVLVPPTPIEDTTFSVMAPPSLKPLPPTMAQILLPVPEMTGSFFVGFRRNPVRTDFSCEPVSLPHGTKFFQ